MSRGQRITNPIYLVEGSVGLVQKWTKIPRETAFQIRKIRGGKLAYTHIGNRQMDNSKIKI